MALTRRALKAMDIGEERIEEIIAMHTETVEGLKADLAKYKSDAEKLPTVQKELDALKAAGDGGLQERFDALQREYDEFKGQVTAKEAKTAKESAVRAYYESKGITGKSLDIAMRGTAPETARPWVAPTGAHDMYRAGEYMIYTDGQMYKCLRDTNFSPTEYAQAWEAVE